MWRILGVFMVLISLLGVLIMTGLEKYINMPGESYTGPEAPLKTEEERTIARNLQHAVAMLSDVIGERNLSRAPERLTAAEAWITQELIQTAGLDVTRLPYTVQGQEVANLEGVKPGTTLPDEILIIGAHYDSAPGTPGANDNGSGVAALLELARLTRHRKYSRTVRFVAFTNEEPPYFTTGDMGSQVYALGCKRAGENIVGMLCLETIGYFSEEPGSQKYPPPLDQVYPDTGNFIAFVGNVYSRDLVHRAIGTFRQHAKIGSQGIAAPSGTPGVDLSDHASFWKHGFPALMITDTAPYRYPYYHTASDLIEHCDFEQMTHIVTGLVPVIDELAGVEGKK